MTTEEWPNQAVEGTGPGVSGEEFCGIGLFMSVDASLPPGPSPGSLSGRTMNTILSAVFMALVLAATSVWAAEDKATEQENSLLYLVLKRSYPDGGYTVVSPKARFSDHPIARSAQEIEKSKKSITEHLKTNGVPVAKLVDRLFERNKKKVRLSLESSPKNGYVIDDGKYEKYFEKDGGGWDKWYKENPKAHGTTTVSLPVYDQKAGLVLVYMATVTRGLAGSGWVILYRYEKGELKELNKVRMWIS